MPRLYLYDRPGWPRLRWDPAIVIPRLAAVRDAQGWLASWARGLGSDVQQEAVLETLTKDVHKTSEIEGEHLDMRQVRSAIATRLGLETGGLHVEKRVEGVVEMTMDTTANHKQPLTRERLWEWQTSLFPPGHFNYGRIVTGDWRDGLVQVVSGPLGQERVHFQAPAADRVEHEMELFLNWFNTTRNADWVTKAALAHLWFVIIHPFEDGNGRVARAITDMALARSENSAQRFYSMSSQIRTERNDYYYILEQTETGTSDITKWMVWFLDCLSRAIHTANATLNMVITRTNFWRNLRTVPLNYRQRQVLTRLLDGFQGKLTTSKWAKLAKCSEDTALHDITNLINQGILIQNPTDGRHISYQIQPNRLHNQTPDRHANP